VIKHLAYCLKSTDEKDKQVLSIDSQLQELKDFAKKENLQIVEIIHTRRVCNYIDTLGI